MKHLLITLIYICACTSAMAQTGQQTVQRRAVKKYIQRVEKKRNEIWNLPLPTFLNSQIPEKYTDAKAIVLADYDSVVYRRNWLFMPFVIQCVFMPIPHMEYFVGAERLKRTRIAINSEESVARYSKSRCPHKLRYHTWHDYSCYGSSTETNVYDHFYDIRATSNSKANLVMGIRIEKPDGRCIEVDTNPYLQPLEKDEQLTNRPDSISLSDLEVGDIVDFFVYEREHFISGLAPYTYSVQQEYPIVSWACRIQSSKRLDLSFIRHGGAPEFTVTKNKRGHFLLRIDTVDVDTSTTNVLQHIVTRVNNRSVSPKSIRKKGVTDCTNKVTSLHWF